MTITVPYPLIDAISWRRLSGDKQLERRIWLADRIRQYANAGNLGPRYRDVEMISEPGTPGPSVAMFFFEEWPGADRREEQDQRLQQISDFVKGLEKLR